MNHFFICRHCKSVLAGPDTERDLDSDGLLQSKSLSNKISELIDSNTIIYSRPFKRAVETGSETPLQMIYLAKAFINVDEDENAKNVLQQIINTETDPSNFIEDSHYINEAKNICDNNF